MWHFPFAHTYDRCLYLFIAKDVSHLAQILSKNSQTWAEATAPKYGMYVETAARVAIDLL
ncbi:MAG: hypothetical protein C5B60_09695 [Chloroflexi bacterium]|nr:MAG: hypothetical protein C5B60_09695 [Chloroflexota bacterium]